MSDKGLDNKNPASDGGINNKKNANPSSDGGVDNENPVKTGEKQAERDDKGRFKPGVTGNPNGRPKGTRNWRTDFEEAIEKIADRTNRSKSDVRTVLLSKGLEKALEGDSRFWTYIVDREYGKEPQPLEGDIDIPGARQMADTLQKILENDNIQDQQNTKESPKENS